MAEQLHSSGSHDLNPGFDYDNPQDPYEGWSPEELAELQKKSKEIDDFHHRAQSEHRTVMIP